MYNYKQFIQQNPNYLSEKTFSFSGLKLNLSQIEFDLECSKLAKFVDLYSQELVSKPELLDELSYPKNSLKYLDTNLSLMRFGFVVDDKMNPKLIEINSQTPSFIWECHDGIIDAFNIANQNVVQYQNNLKNYLQNAIKLVDIKLNRVTKPRIGIVCCDHKDDLFQMNYLQDIIESTQSSSYVEVLTIDKLDINARELIFSIDSNKEFDALFFWYPIEWLANEKFNDGSGALESIFDLIQKSKVYIINGMQSFVVQNKEFLAKIYESKDALPDMIIPSFYTKDELVRELKNIDFIAKPVFGREGQGIFGQKGDDVFEGDLSDSYYTDQNYIYQPLIKTNEITIDNINYKYTLEKWVFKIDGVWYPGGQSIRLNNKDSLITDNECTWLGLK